MNGTQDYNHCGVDTGPYREQTLPVGILQANPWGLHDMLGDAWALTCSAHESDSAGAGQCCMGKDDLGCPVLRGASWLGRDIASMG